MITAASVSGSQGIVRPYSERCGQLRSLAFSVYSRCQPAFVILAGQGHLTSFGPMFCVPEWFLKGMPQVFLGSCLYH